MGQGYTANKLLLDKRGVWIIDANKMLEERGDGFNA